MNKDIVENIEKRVNETVASLWSTIDILRTSIPSSEYYVFLYIITLQSEGILSKINHSGLTDIKSDFRKCISESRNKHSETFQEMLLHYGIVLEKISELEFRKLLLHIHNINFNFSQNSFQLIFESILSKMIELNGKFSGETSINQEVSKLMIDLANLQVKSNVYNPFSGISTFALDTTNINTYLGQEINPHTAAIAKLRLIAHNIDQVKVETSDSLIEWNPLKIKYDLIISAPPFGVKLNFNQIGGKWGLIKNVEQFVLENGLDDLSENGKLILLLPQGVLHNGGVFQNIREYVVDKDLLEYVITLPGNLLLNTSINTVILVFNKNKIKKNSIRFVDATKLFIQKSIRKVELDIVRISDNIKGNTNENCVIEIDNDEVRSQGYSLTIGRYFYKKQVNSNIENIEIGQILNYVRGERGLQNQFGKFVRIRNLNDNPISFDLKTDILEEVNMPRHAIKISESCLLIAARWKSLKPTYFRYEGTPVYITPDIMAFKFDETLVDPSYLIHELCSKQVEEQLSVLITNGVIPSLRRDDFLGIQIDVLPLLEQQKAKVNGIKEVYFKSKERELELEKQIQGYKEDKTREFQSIKHTFRQYLSALNSNISGTKKFIKKNEDKPISFKMIYSANLNQTFGEHLQSLEDTIASLNKLLEIGETSIATGSNINMLELIKSAQNRFKKEELFEFEELFFDENSFDDNGTEIIPFIHMSEEDFFIIFSNIITNAVDHGFKVSNKKNIIRTSLSYDKALEMCKLEISNNGNPIPDAFSIKHLTTRGEKTTDSKGTGSGGADIKNIIDKYNGIFDLLNLKEEDFPVTYIIKFPLIKIESA